MHPDTTTPMNKIMLQGAWSIGEAAERLRFLAGEFDLLLVQHPKSAAVEIDFAEIESIDACGCQLLAVFLENLKRQNFVPQALRVPPEISEEIRLLGFLDAFAHSTDAEKDNA
jgi:anti-anti-sigma regulatory factor